MSKASSIYDDSSLIALNFSPEQCHARLGEVMALFDLLVKLAPSNPDAVKHSAWTKSRTLIRELKIVKTPNLGSKIANS